MASGGKTDALAAGVLSSRGEHNVVSRDAGRSIQMPRLRVPGRAAGRLSPTPLEIPIARTIVVDPSASPESELPQSGGRYVGFPHYGGSGSHCSCVPISVVVQETPPQAGAKERSPRERHDNGEKTGKQTRRARNHLVATAGLRLSARAVASLSLDGFPEMIVFLVLLASAAVIGAGHWWLIVVVVAALAAGTAVSLAAVRGASALPRLLDRRAHESRLPWGLAATVSALPRHRLGRGAAVLVTGCLRVLVAAGIVAAALEIAGMHVPWLGLILTFGCAEPLLRRPRANEPASQENSALTIKSWRPGSTEASRRKSRREA
jgi:hypothetical protein